MPVFTAAYSLHPIEVIKVPLHSLVQAGFEAFARAPTQFFLDFARIDRVASIVPGSIAHEADAVSVRPGRTWFACRS